MKISKSKNEQQEKIWKGDFGDEYVNRIITKEIQNSTYKERTGFTEEEIFKEFFQDLDRNITILEVGCNRGLKLSILQDMGFKNLNGIEINQKAAAIAQQYLPTARIFNQSIEEFNEKSNYDLVYTATMLIHVNPLAIEEIILKMDNLSKKYIFGLEYFSEKLEKVEYRNQEDALWKQNFPEIFKKINSNWDIEKKRIIQYKDEKKKDIIYLLRKN
jgi:pseudaminic acid biosynthesis-associated methylase